jgi:hypothetical protein
VDENTGNLIDNVNFGKGIKNLNSEYNVEVIIFSAAVENDQKIA